MMTYAQARRFAQEASKSGSVLGLASIRALMSELNDVQETLPIIHLAGTNGKGSVGAYLASIFCAAGLSVARYTSPAVFDPLEVFTYNGENITESEYAKVMSQVKDACDIMVSAGKECPTIFEIETAVAFLWFYEKKPDIVLLETGMGGATDATNLITHPLASVITTISMDHMQFLGNTLGEIAAVKAGIIKENCPVFSAPQKPEVVQVLKKTAEEKHAGITFVDGEKLQIREEKPGTMAFSCCLETGNAKEHTVCELTTSMSGHYQMRNAALAANVAFQLFPKVKANDSATGTQREEILALIQKGIADASWPGRFEVLGTNPLFVIDGAHNEDAAKELAATIENCFTNTKLTYIIGVLADKEHDKMLRLMSPYACRVYTVTPDNTRALSAKALAAEARTYYEHVTEASSVEQALSFALEHEEPVLAFGSLSYLGQLRNAYKKQNRKKDG